MAKGIVFIGIICVLAHSVVALVTKNFEKYRIKDSSINNSTELAFIPKMDFFECSYFCMKKGEDCKTFYITKDGSCRKVELNTNQCHETGLPENQDTIVLYSTIQIITSATSGMDNFL